jgi:hypothetical protein
MCIPAKVLNLEKYILMTDVRTCSFKNRISSINLSIYLWLCSRLLDLGRSFSFLILYTAGRTSNTLAIQVTIYFVTIIFLYFLDEISNLVFSWKNPEEGKLSFDNFLLRRIEANETIACILMLPHTCTYISVLRSSRHTKLFRSTVPTERMLCGMKKRTK